MEIPSDFCETCGELLEMPLYGEVIQCSKCGASVPLQSFISKPIITEINYNDKKEWIEEYKRHRGEIAQKQEQKSVKATIKHDCPKCDSKQAYYWTQQTRSADEGSTVFYQCVKCEYTSTQNN